MSMTASRPANRAHPSAPESSPAERLRATMAACRVQFRWPGTQKALSAEQKAEAARPFDAEAPYLSASKKLVDTAHPAFRAVTAIRSRIVEDWRGHTLPFPEPGVRLMRTGDVAPFDARMRQYQAELEAAVGELEERYAELKDAARRRLGSLYRDEDYPEALAGLFAVCWDYPAIEPPSYLVQLSPELYRRERERVAARFEEAVRLAEEAFRGEFARLVSHLTGRLSGADAEGRPLVFRDTAVTNLREFFDRFRSLSVRSDAELEALVAEAQRVVQGLAPQDLRDEAGLRRTVATQLARVQSDLEALLVERPRRRILRGPATTGPA